MGRGGGGIWKDQNGMGGEKGRWRERDWVAPEGSSGRRKDRCGGVREGVIVEDSEAGWDGVALFEVQLLARILLACHHTVSHTTTGCDPYAN